MPQAPPPKDGRGHSCRNAERRGGSGGQRRGGDGSEGGRAMLTVHTEPAEAELLAEPTLSGAPREPPATPTSNVRPRDLSACCPPLPAVPERARSHTPLVRASPASSAPGVAVCRCVSCQCAPLGAFGPSLTTLRDRLVPRAPRPPAPSPPCHLARGLSMFMKGTEATVCGVRGGDDAPREGRCRGCTRRQRAEPRRRRGRSQEKAREAALQQVPGILHVSSVARAGTGQGSWRALRAFCCSREQNARQLVGERTWKGGTGRGANLCAPALQEARSAG